MRCLVSLVPCRARLLRLGPAVAAVLAGTAAVAPGVAGAQGCAEADPSYLDACGPTFQLPAWGDGAGWTDPSQYSTIQLADVNGDGRDELIARNDQGLEIWWFDTTIGQWQPQVDAQGHQQVLTDFRSPLPNETPDTDWTKPEYYSTIQTAHIDGNPKAQVLARFADGMRVYYFQPGPNGSINGGTWSLISRNGPFGDADGWNVASRYASIRMGSITENTPGTTDLIGRAAGGLVAYDWNGSGWSALPLAQTDVNTWFDDASCSLPSCYLLFRTPALGGLGQTVVGRPGGSQLELVRYDSGAESWSDTDAYGQPFSDVPGRGSDCPFPGTSDCLGSSPSYYETLGAADVDGDGADEVFARAADGLRVKSPRLTGGTTYDDQGGTISFEGGGWTRAQNVPGAINGTETSSSQDVRVIFSADVGSVVQVIGPVGPGLGRFGVSLDERSRQITWVNQSAPRRREQQVLFEAIVPGADDGEVEIFPGGGTVTIDAFRTYPSERRAWSPLPTLTDLAGAGLIEVLRLGLWGSIRTGDIDGDHKEEVLALDGTALQAWSLNGSTWSRLPTSNALALNGDWLTTPEYYSTIRVGDVDGDGREDVVARGPFGIRTWFYDRRGSGGWERYLGDGYPDFPSRQCPSGVTGSCGQQGAYAALNGLAVSSGTVRDVWTSVTAPDSTTLSTLQTSLVKPIVGNCPTQTRLEPPAYAACIPPANSSALFTAEEWTAVVNQLLSEAYYAEQVVDHFGDVETMRKGLFESESNALPAIDAQLQLAGAAGNTTQFDFQSFFAGTTGIAASIAGLAAAGGPEVSAALWVASEIISMLPSASPTANSTFQATYAGLLGKLATAQEEMADEVTSQRQQVLGDQGLLGVVGQLRSRGTWKPDVDGLQAASRQAFVLETYKALMPTIYDRYQVTNCIPSRGAESCSGPSPGPGVIGDGQNFTTIGLPPSTSGGLSVTPCIYHTNTGSYYCHYETNSPPAEVMTRIWGPMDPSCDYKPPKKTTLWHYGCSLGVPAATSIGADSGDWAFATHTANPVTFVSDSARRAGSATPGVVRATVARAGASARAPRKVLDPLRFTGRVALARGLRVRRARVVVERALFEHGRREELARSRSGRRLRPFALRHLRGGLFASRRRGGPRVRLRLRQPDGRASARVGLRLTGVRTQDVRALCTVLPARVTLAGRPLELETRLRLRDGAQTSTITMRQRWRCVRDRKGEFTGIRPVKPKRPAARPGLSVGIKAPHVSASGRRATVRVTVANLRRKRPTRVVSSLWDLDITATAGGAPRTIEIKELRARRSRTLRLTLPVPRSARGRVCVQVAVTAASARGAGTRRCAGIAGAPRFTG